MSPCCHVALYVQCWLQVNRETLRPDPQLPLDTALSKQLTHLLIIYPIDVFVSVFFIDNIMHLLQQV